MPVSDWLDLMPATVTYEAVASRDEYGKPATYSAAVSYRARVSYTTRRVINRANGQDAVSSTTVWLNGNIPSMQPDDRITLPDGSTPKILSWDIPMDETDNHHQKVYFSG